MITDYHESYQDHELSRVDGNLTDLITESFENRIL